MLLSALLLACTGSGDVAAPGGAAPASVVEDTLVDASWLVATAPAEALGALSGETSWQAFFGRDYAAALAAAAPGVVQARLHAEVAALYRQALLIQANAIVRTYEASQRREGDPPEVDYVLGVSYLVLGQPDAARAALEAGAKVGDAAVATAARAWLSRLDGEGSWLSLSADPALFPLPEVAPGALPELPAEAHYEVPETIGDQAVRLADPTALLQAAIWHEQASVAAGSAGLTASLLAPWRLPAEAVAAGAEVELPVEALFMSAWTSAGDLQFLTELAAGAEVAAALSKHAPRSTYAALAASCMEGAALDVECVQDGAIALARQFEARMASAAGGPSPDHRTFLDFVRSGALQAGARVAEAAGADRDAGRLRINARDRAIEAAADPVFLFSFAAWDAGQRNAQRALDLYHGYVDSLPGLQAARASLDALQLRASRDAGPAIPVH